MIQVKKIDGGFHVLETNNLIEEHFGNPYNYTKEIMAQFEDSIYKNFINESDKVILDIGGNVGLFSLHVSPYAEKIVIVEPTPNHMDVQKCVLKNVGCVTHEESALNSFDGQVKFNWCGINTTMNSLQFRHDPNYFMVNGITLESLFKKHNLESVDFCKIDIEGSEHTAITEELLKPVADKIKKAFIELHPPDAETQDKFKAIFENCGFKVEKVIHDTLFCYK